MGAHIVTGCLLDTFFSLNVSRGSERRNINEIRDLINLEMPQLNEALSPNTASTQVIDGSYGGLISRVQNGQCFDKI